MKKTNRKSTEEEKQLLKGAASLDITSPWCLVVASSRALRS